jgi:hypothetical protein
MDLSKLGKPLSAMELATILGVSANTVRRHRDRWGGIEVAPGLLRFFENIVKEKIYADAGQEEPAPLEGGGHGQRKTERETLSRRIPAEQTRRHRVGESNAGEVEGQVEDDPHGLLS